MNIHLANLYKYLFVRVIYGAEVKALPICWDISHPAFPVRRNFTCAVALAHIIRAHYISRTVYTLTQNIVGRLCLGQFAHVWCITSDKQTG